MEDGEKKGVWREYYPNGTIYREYNLEETDNSFYKLYKRYNPAGVLVFSQEEIEGIQAGSNYLTREFDGGKLIYENLTNIQVDYEGERNEYKVTFESSVDKYYYPSGRMWKKQLSEDGEIYQTIIYDSNGLEIAEYDSDYNLTSLE